MHRYFPVSISFTSCINLHTHTLSRVLFHLHLISVININIIVSTIVFQLSNQSQSIFLFFLFFHPFSLSSVHFCFFLDIESDFLWFIVNHEHKQTGEIEEKEKQLSIHCNDFSFSSFFLCLSHENTNSGSRINWTCAQIVAECTPWSVRDG